MKEFYRNFLENNLYFWVFGGVSILLILVSFFIPPMAVVDGSIIACVGELFGFAALGAVIHAIDKGKTASISHGNTTIEIRKEGEEENGDTTF